VSLNIGESSAVITVLHFFNPQSEDRPDNEEVLAALTMLRNKAGNALQVSGEHIISDAEMQDMVDSINLWIEYDEDYAADEAAQPITTIDTHGRT
jgi:hypothetical protein